MDGLEDGLVDNVGAKLGVEDGRSVGAFEGIELGV